MTFAPGACGLLATHSLTRIDQHDWSSLQKTAIKQPDGIPDPGRFLLPSNQIHVFPITLLPLQAHVVCAPTPEKELLLFMTGTISNIVPRRGAGTLQYNIKAVTKSAYVS